MASNGARGGGGGRRVAVPIYQIDFTAVASGKHFASSKRRVRWRFGFANTEALDSGETGTACRGEEHDVTLVWSVTSGKRLILADGHEVHYSNIRGQQFEFSWTMKGNHVLKVIAYAAPPINPIPNFRQYDFFVDGQSFFTMPKVYRLGLNGSTPSGSHGQASMPAAHRSPTYNNYNTGNVQRADSTNIVNLEAPQNEDEEEAFLKRALEESMQDNQQPGQVHAPSPAPVQSDLLDFGDAAPAAASAQIGYAAESSALTGHVATENRWAQQNQFGQSCALVPSQQPTNQFQIPGATPKVGACDTGFSQSFNASPSNGGYANQQSYITAPPSSAPYQPNQPELDPFAQAPSPFASTPTDHSFAAKPSAFDSGDSVPDTQPPAFGGDSEGMAYDNGQGVSNVPAPFVAPVPSAAANGPGIPPNATAVEHVFSKGYGAVAEVENIIGTSRSAEDAYNKIKMGEFSLDTKAAVNPFDMAPKQQNTFNVHTQKTEKKPVMNAPPGAMVVSSQQGGNWGGALNNIGGSYPQQGTGGNMYGAGFQQPQYGGQPLYNNAQQQHMQPGQYQQFNQYPPYNQQQQWQAGSQGNAQFRSGS